MLSYKSVAPIWSVYAKFKIRKLFQIHHNNGLSHMTEGKASMNGNLANAAREMNRKEGQEASSFCVPPKEDLGLPSNKVVQFELEPLTAQPLE